MTKLIKREIIKAPSRDLTAELIQDDVYDGIEYVVKISAGTFHRVIKKCSLRCTGEYEFNKVVKECKDGGVK